MEREQFYLTIGGENLKKIGAMAERLNMNRVDVIEVIISVYFAYVNCQKAERIRERQEMRCI